MSIESVCDGSDIYILDIVAVKLPGMDLRRGYRARKEPVRGRVSTTSVRESAPLFMRGIEADHKIYFGVYPGELTEENRLRIDGVLYRPVSILVDVQKRGRFWTLYATTRTRDNEKVVMID